MSRHTVLAISPDIEQLSRLVDTLERAGAKVDALRSTSAIQSQNIGHRYVFVDIGDGATGGQTNLDFVLTRSSRRTHIVVIADNASLQELVRLLEDERVNHIITRQELEAAVVVTARKLLSGDIFGIEHYLPPKTPVHYCRLNDFAGRGKAIDVVTDYAKDFGIRSRLRDSIAQVCEELLMNALYDAPVDDSGTQVFSAIDPHDRVKICSPRPVSIRFAATETQFVIAVRDRYGRLAKNTIVAYINKCLSSPNQIDRKAHGAGLGIYLIANAAASYVVNVAYDVATEVICTFDRKEKRPLRMVGVFVHPTEAEMLKQGPTPMSASDATTTGRE